jgi:probable F420-dependent oxidoreductase
MIKKPGLCIILSELETLIRPAEDRLLLRMAQEADDAGCEGIQIIDHLVMGPNSNRNGSPSNPRDYRWIGNQEPAQHMPSQIVMLSAIAAVTTRIRLMATATLAPLRHPLLNAKNWATLDGLSGGRLTILPIGGWQDEEYAAFGIPFEERGRRLDEQLEIMQRVWRETPASYRGEFYTFDEIYVMPKPVQAGGPEIIIGGDRFTEKVIRRIVRYGSGHTILNPPTPAQLARLDEEMSRAGRKMSELITTGLVFPSFPGPDAPADLARSIEESLPPFLEAGVDRITIKPSQFIEDPAEFSAFLEETDRRIEALL